jgi:ADP-heptose:LPS heptosyltransferase
MGAPAVNLAGEVTLKELAVLAGLSKVVISVDSGPMHIASAAGATVVAIFGPTAPERTGPYGDRHIIVRKGLPCSPCFKKSCREASCMREITVQEVFASVEMALKETRAPLPIRT